MGRPVLVQVAGLVVVNAAGGIVENLKEGLQWYAFEAVVQICWRICKWKGRPLLCCGTVLFSSQ